MSSTARKKLEADLEEQCKRYVEYWGGRFLKIKLESERGFFDREIWLPNATAWCELKIGDGTGVLSPHQQHWIEVAKSLNKYAFVCDNFVDFRRHIQNLIMGR